MAKYAVFLRGVNVGGRIIRMAELKACFETMSFANVSTLLQTGNVLFEASAKPGNLKHKIETGLSQTFNYPAKAQVYSLEELADVVDAYPFGTAGADQHDYVIFLEKGLEQALVSENYALSAGEQVRAGDGVVYWRVNKGSTLKTSFAKLLTRAKYKDFNTNRNLKTLRKIVSKPVT